MNVQLIGFRVGGEHYAVDILSVVQIILPQKPVKVAQAPPFIEGVIRLRDLVVPIVDLRKRFGVEARPAKALPGTEEGAPSGRILVTRVDASQHVGLVVDAATQVIRTEREKFLHAPEVFLRGESAYTGDVYQDADGRMYMVLDPSKILTLGERRALDAMPRANEERKNA